MRISIAMAVYNGAKYIKEQLESFSQQTRLPDELIVTDDGSIDGTLGIIEKFAYSAPFDVKIYRNDENIGYAKNFCKAMQLCTGDLIFLSDQDDFWFKEKLEQIEDMAANDVRNMVFINDAEITNSELVATGLTKAGQIKSIGLDSSRFITGCCTAIRREFVQVVCPVPDTYTAHDTWLHSLARLLEVRVVVNKSLQYYRRYDGNTSNWLPSSTRKVTKFDQFINAAPVDPRPSCNNRLKQIESLKERIMFGENFRDDGLEILRDKALQLLLLEENAVKKRLEVLCLGRINRIRPSMTMYASGGYKYFSGFKSFIKDILR